MAPTGPPINVGDRKTQSSSTKRASINSPARMPPPSQRTRRMPSLPSSSAKAGRKRLFGSSRTAAPVLRIFRAQAGCQPLGAATRVRAACSSVKIWASRGSGPFRTTTTRHGVRLPSGRGHSEGLSCRTVPAPTMTASEARRMAWTILRASGPVIQREQWV